MAVRQSAVQSSEAALNALQATVLTIPLPPEGLPLERGGTLPEVTVAVEVYGHLNAARDNVIWVCHALTGSAHAADLPNTAVQNFPHLEWQTPHESDNLLATIADYPGWWHGVIGPGKALDTDSYCVIVPNILGSCYGTTGPLSMNPQTDKPYRRTFPAITVRDMVRVQKLLLDLLEIPRITVIGGSLGGMQVLEWAIMFPERVQRLIPIATSAAHSPWAIAWNEIARQAILQDPRWQNGNYTQQPRQGMALARMAAMISYRSFISFQQKFGRERRPAESAPPEGEQFQVASYLHYQGEKFYRRFDANSYLTLTEAMDWHDVGEGRGDVAEVLATIHQPACVIGIPTDHLYPVSEQQFLVEHIPGAHWQVLNSVHGHDGFLIEWPALNRILREFFERT